MLVHTTKGLIERDRLTVKDIIDETDNSRCIATEWYLDGELVRRDGWANIYSPLPISGAQTPAQG